MIIHGKNLKGFTMVETLVSLAIFGFISIVLVNIFVSSLKSQIRILQNQQLMEQSSYTVEYMGKIIRMAKKDTAGTCTKSANTNYGVGQSGEVSLSFLAYDSVASAYKCRKFLLDGNAMKELRSSDQTWQNLGTAIPITSSKVKITGTTFVVSGDATNKQPRVTIMMNMQSNVSSANAPSLIIQTTISQRQLNSN